MTARAPKIVVVGGTYVDMAIKCDELPTPGEKIIGSSLSYTVTGPGPNQAAEAALCGCGVQLISKVGGDCFADSVKETLADFNVDTSFLYTAEAKYTGTNVTIVNSLGENSTIAYTGANAALHPADIEAAEQAITEADICLIHGKLRPDTITAAIRCAELGGTKVILNPARPIEQINNQSHTLPTEYFMANILIPNLYEAADITEHSADIHTAKLIGSDIIARGAGAAVITMGKRGCMVVDRTGADHIPAFEIELIDQSARGDAFAGALAAYYAVEHDLRAAVRFASAAGALACTKFGAIESMPTKAEIIELLQSREV